MELLEDLLNDIPVWVKDLNLELITQEQSLLSSLLICHHNFQYSIMSTDVCKEKSILIVT